MTSYILALISALSFFSHSAMAEVHFKVQTVESTLAQAKSEQKLILRVCSSEQCHWCRWMEKNVWNDTYLGQSINSQLIPILPAFNRMDFMQNCKVVPSTIFLDENGKIVQTVDGKRDLEQMKKIVGDILSANCTGKDEKLDESLGTRRGSACCAGLVKEVKDGAGFCVTPTCIETSTVGIPLKGNPRETPPCCDDSAEKEMTFGTIGSPERIRCIEQRIHKKINQSSRDSRKPHILSAPKQKKSGSKGSEL